MLPLAILVVIVVTVSLAIAVSRFAKRSGRKGSRFLSWVVVVSVCVAAADVHAALAGRASLDRWVWVLGASTVALLAARRVWHRQTVPETVDTQ
jgi:lipopolysaccharide export LptBFGC system permease protein LptF